MRHALALLLVSALSAAAPPMPRFRWQNFTTADGLPDNKVFSVAVDGERVWAGTDNGLAMYQGGKWKVFRPQDGLAHRAVLYVAVDKKTHDVWIATMGGLSRYSAGRFDTYTQLNSGLSNDVVYGVAVQDDEVWTATAAGASRLNTRTGQWTLYNERNTPMYEIWTYAVSPGKDKVYFAVWGGGVLEYDVKNDRWKDYNDPDGETEIVLFKDQGLIHEITTSVSYVEKDKIVWVATYFGASRYDGRNWRNFLDQDSGLPSNFLNQVKAVDEPGVVLDRQGSGLLRRQELVGVPAVARDRPARDADSRPGGARHATGCSKRAGPPLRIRRRFSGRRHLGGDGQGVEPRGRGEGGVSDVTT